MKREEDLQRWMDKFCVWRKKNDNVGDGGGAKGMR